MNKNIDIMSELLMLDNLANNKLTDSILISISCPGHSVNIDNEKVIDYISLEFEDIHDEMNIPEEQLANYVCFNSFHANQIKEFVEKYNNVKNIAINCGAGVSRSAGVACALALIYNGDDFYIRNTNKYIPNNKCFYLTLKAFNMKLSDEEKTKRAELAKKQMDENYQKYCQDGLMF